MSSSDNPDGGAEKLDLSSDSYTLPTIEVFRVKKFYDHANSIDFEDLEEINHAIYRAKEGLIKADESLSEYSARLKKASTAYDRAWTRKYLASVEKTDKARQSYASIQCEEIENEKLAMEAMVESLKRMNNLLRKELDILTTLSNNFRQQMKM